MHVDRNGSGDGRELVPTRREEIAWAAGLFEGEGTMAFRGTQGKRGSGAQLRLGMTDRDVVERFAKVVGDGGLYTGKPRAKNPKWKIVHTWYLYEAAKIVEILEEFLPWFGERRHERCMEVLEFARTVGVHAGKKTHCPRGHEYDSDNLILEPIMRDGRRYFARRCKICRTEQSRERARKRLGITADRYRVTG